nr:putative leader peptide [Streptomyces chattanoogensis]
MGRGSNTRTGNRYDDRMVDHDVSEKRPGMLLPAPLAVRRSASALLGAFGCGAARLHVDLCRLSSAICPRCAAA